MCTNCFFLLKFKDFINLTNPDSKEYYLVLNKIEELKENYFTENTSLPEDGNHGYCNFMTNHNIINKDDFYIINDFEKRVFQGELGRTKINELLNFIKMSTTC